jgi:hypothetical protein
MGSSKTNIRRQFFMETLVTTLLAVMLCVFLVPPVLHAFADYIPAGVHFHPFQASTLIFLATITVFR